MEALLCMLQSKLPLIVTMGIALTTALLKLIREPIAMGRKRTMTTANVVVGIVAIIAERIVVSATVAVAVEVVAVRETVAEVAVSIAAMEMMMRRKEAVLVGAADGAEFRFLSRSFGSFQIISHMSSCIYYIACT